MTQVKQLQLLAACALADNRDAFGQLVEAYQPRIRRLLLNLTMGDTNLADDLAQETFLKAYLGIRSFNGLANFSTWLYRIACNEFYAAVRNRKPTISIDNPEAERTLPSDGNDAFEARDSLNIAMNALSETERAIVTLFYIEDQPIKKIASICHLPEGTVKSHLHRAKAKMTQTLTSKQSAS